MPGDTRFSYAWYRCYSPGLEPGRWPRTRNAGGGAAAAGSWPGGGGGQQQGTRASRVRVASPGQRSQPNPVVLVSTFGRLCRSPGAISSIRHWLCVGTPRSGELGPGGRALCMRRPVYGGCDAMHAEGGASYVPSYVPYVSHKLRLRVPLRVPYKSHTSPIRVPLRMSLRVPYVSRTCPVRVPYVSRTCPIRQENLHAVRASRMRWKSRSRVTRRGQQ